MKKILTVFFILVSLNFLYAAENSVVNNNASSTDTNNSIYAVNKYNAFGLSASSVSGAGLSYWHGFTDDFSTRITGIWIYTSDKVSGPSNEDGYETTKDYSLGLEFQGDLFDASSQSSKYKMRTFFFTGGSYWYGETENDVDASLNDKDEYYTIGMGIGLEQIFFNTISITIEVGYQYKASLIDKKERGTDIGGGIGAAFHF